MHTLPYVFMTNEHISHVYELYNKTFNLLRRVPEIISIDENDRYCKIVRHAMQEHLTVIPKLVTGVLECQDMVKPETLDQLMNTMLKSVR